jgi:hypothetical protein
MPFNHKFPALALAFLEDSDVRQLAALDGAGPCRASKTIRWGDGAMGQAGMQSHAFREPQKKGLRRAAPVRLPSAPAYWCGWASTCMGLGPERMARLCGDQMSVAGKASPSWKRVAGSQCARVLDYTPVLSSCIQVVVYRTARRRKTSRRATRAGQKRELANRGSRQAHNPHLQRKDRLAAIPCGSIFGQARQDVVPVRPCTMLLAAQVVFLLR